MATQNLVTYPIWWIRWRNQARFSPFSLILVLLVVKLVVMLVVVRSKDPSSNPQRGLSHLVEFHWIAFLLCFFFTFFLFYQFSSRISYLPFALGEVLEDAWEGLDLDDSRRNSPHFSQNHLFSPPPLPPPLLHLLLLPGWRSYRERAVLSKFSSQWLLLILLSASQLLRNFGKTSTTYPAGTDHCPRGPHFLFPFFLNFSFLLDFVRFLIRP